jgi:mRNA interferase MazF
VVSINRGDIYWVDLGETENHAPAKFRPLLIVQVDKITQTAIGTVIGSALTTRIEAGKFPGAVFVPHEVSGLSKDSVVKLTELLTVDKWQLGEYAGHLSSEYMLQIDNALREVLGL